MDWINTQQPGQYTFTTSYTVDPTLTTGTGSSISATQMDLLNSYDLIISPRYGTGASSNMASTDWNDVTTPLLLMNPFMVADGTRWGWVPPGTSTPTSPAIQDMVVVDSTSALFNGVDTSGDAITFYTGPNTTMQPEVDSSLLTGNVVAWTDRREGDTDDPQPDPLGDYREYPWLVLWDGTESSFFAGGTEAPAGRRTLFLGHIGMDADSLTPEAQQIYLNAINATIPEPSTYAFFFGLAALGAVVVLRRKRA